MIRVIGVLLLVGVWVPLLAPELLGRYTLACQVLAAFVTSIVALVCIVGRDYGKKSVKQVKTRLKYKNHRLGRSVIVRGRGMYPEAWLRP